MTDATADTRSVIVERDLPFAPERVWRALTQPHLIGEWLMRTDFEPVLGRPFTLTGDWGAVACRVEAIEPERSLSYTWDAFGLESVVTWTLTPSGAGTRLRMEQAGFRPEQGQFLAGAEASWPQLLTALEGLLAREGD